MNKDMNKDKGKDMSKSKNKIVKLGVLGRPIEHSRSPEIHQLFSAQTGISLSYEKILVPEGQFNAIAIEFLQTGKGFNITTPCKHEAFLLAREHSLAATLAGAVNTISVNAAGIISGDNTDGPGLIQDMTHNLGWTIKGKKLLVLGAGGAVSGLLPSLLDAEPQEIHLHNRTQQRAVALVQRLGDVRLVSRSADTLDAAYDLVINGTSGSLFGEMNKLPDDIVAGGSCCYDLVYGAETTAFNHWCLQQADCMVADGLGMLVEQAALAFHIWFAQEIKTPLSTRPVIDTLRHSMQAA